MQKYINNVQDTFGNAVESVTVTIRTNPGGVLASIFSDNSGSVKANPFTNDSDGEFFFYAADGRYDIELTGPITETKSDVRLLDIITTGSSIQINANIVTATPPTTEGVTALLRYSDLDNTDDLALVGFDNSVAAEFRISNLMRGGAVRITGLDVGGTIRSILVGDPDGEASMYYAGTKRIGSSANGARLFSSGNTDSEQRRLEFSYADGTNRAIVGHNGASTFIIRNQIHGAPINLESENNSGVTKTLFEGDPDGAASLYYAGVKRISSDTDGRLTLYSDGNLDTENRLIEFKHQNNSLRATFGFIGNDVFQLRNRIHGGSIDISSEDSVGTNRTILTGDPDAETILRADTNIRLQIAAGELALLGIANAAVHLYYDNQENFRTSAEASSAIGMGAEVRHNDDQFYAVGMNLVPEISAIDSANETLAQNIIGKMITYNTATSRSLFFNSDSAIRAGSMWALIVGPSAGVLTGDGGTGVVIRWWNGAGWTSTAAAGNITIGKGQYTIWKETNTLFWISGPNLS